MPSHCANCTTRLKSLINKATLAQLFRIFVEAVRSEDKSEIQELQNSYALEVFTREDRTQQNSGQFEYPCPSKGDINDRENGKYILILADIRKQNATTQSANRAPKGGATTMSSGKNPDSANFFVLINVITPPSDRTRRAISQIHQKDLPRRENTTWAILNEITSMPCILAFHSL